MPSGLRYAAPVAASASSSTRVASIDMLKGCAILWVLLIHSEALGQRRIFLYLVNHAVPIFIVLFGLNSELWWRRRTFAVDLGEWYRTRLRRLLLPVWAAVPVWWAIAFAFRPPGLRLRAALLIRQLVGYMPQIGTSWFITMILQLAIVFPFLHLAWKRLGGVVVLGLGILCLLLGCTFEPQLIGLFGGDWLGFFRFIAFSPRFYGHVAFGMLLASRLGRLDWRVAAAAALLLVPCLAVQEGLLGTGRLPAAYGDKLMDLPLTVVLLVVLRPFERMPLVAPTLTWLGQSSYGIYIGQMLTHNAFVYAYGLPGLHLRLDPWLYTVVLLAGGLAAVWVGERLLRLAERVRGSSRLPSFAR